MSCCRGEADRPLKKWLEPDKLMGSGHAWASMLRLAGCRGEADRPPQEVAGARQADGERARLGQRAGGASGGRHAAPVSPAAAPGRQVPGVGGAPRCAVLPCHAGQLCCRPAAPVPPAAAPGRTSPWSRGCARLRCAAVLPRCPAVLPAGCTIHVWHPTGAKFLELGVRPGALRCPVVLLAGRTISTCCPPGRSGSWSWGCALPLAGALLFPCGGDHPRAADAWAARAGKSG